MDLLILESEGFSVHVPENPHVDRLDGGHIIITPKVRVVDRTQLDPRNAIELIKLTMIIGEAMQTVLNRRGIDVVRINYQDNGNWGLLELTGPFLHVHLYGRAKSSRFQKHGEALYLPSRTSNYYANCSPLNEDDVIELHEEIKRISLSEKYKRFCWSSETNCSSPSGLNVRSEADATDNRLA
jgi:diadenosine tetraphosphate (Ap4A) HIT family hydrolase